jgi:hypothetical protein
MTMNKPTLCSQAHLQVAQAKKKIKTCKRASDFPANTTAFQDGFRIAHAQKTK